MRTDAELWAGMERWSVSPVRMHGGRWTLNNPQHHKALYDMSGPFLGWSTARDAMNAALDALEGVESGAADCG